MAKRTIIKRGAYYDSVKLMLVSRDLSSTPGVNEVAVVMGTELNMETLERTGLQTDESRAATQTDLIIGVDAQDEATIDAVIARASELLDATAGGGEGEAYRPRSLSGALKVAPNSNVLIVSVPGAHARPLVSEGIRKGMHVMLFSDNVPLDDEIALKQAAVKRGVLMMGPDCGTAMLNGVPLCFANAVRGGRIGLVSASGTGSQEVMTLIDTFGGGISQAIGTGGRDLKAEVGGLTFLQALEALNDDPETDVIVLVSKPPAPAVAEKVEAFVREHVTKPVVADFLGAHDEEVTEGGITFTTSLERCAALGVEKATGATIAAPWSDELIAEKAAELRERVPAGSFLKGLYAGGTLAYEAELAVLKAFGEVETNLGSDDRLDESATATHVVIDFGDDAYTRGRAHPMIDSTLRAESFEAQLANPSTGVILMDFVLGWGASRTPQADFIEIMNASDSTVPVIASVCGVEADPQGKAQVVRELEAAGFIVAPTNRAAVDLACAVIAKEEQR